MKGSATFALLVAASVASSTAGAQPDADADAAFEAIVNSGGEGEQQTLVEQMQRWISAHPTHPDVPRGQVWMAKLLLWKGDEPRAVELFHRVAAEHPDTDLATESELALATLELGHLHFKWPLEIYKKHASSPDPKWRYLARKGLDDVRREYYLFLVFLAAVGVLLAFTALRAWLVRRAKASFWPPPEEVTYPLPVLGVVLLASLAQPAEAALAVRVFALGALALLWANGVYLRARPPQRFARLREALLGVGQVVLLTYCALIVSGLWLKFLETLETGIES
ncbi:MAG: hypothetical protein IPJ65_43700 [Archangiaceae bacterium]|nr:hypothetical protein [Archangiaceae bacterium]